LKRQWRNLINKPFLLHLYEVRLEQPKGGKMANRTYEVMYIGAPETADEDITKLNEAIQQQIERDGGTIVKTEVMGRRKLAYPIQKKTEGHYTLFEIEGSGQEIAELERRFRINDAVLRFITVRVDEERKTAAKLTAKRENRQSRRRGGASNFNDQQAEQAQDNQ
jgi:small subunit ribosomal protein S6